MAYTTVDLVSAELKGLTINTSTTPSEEQVNRWIKEAKAEIETKTGRIYETSTFTSTLYDYDGSGYFKFPFRPLISVTSLEYETQGLGADSTSWSTLTSGRTNDYILYVNDAEIMFTGRKSVPRGYQNLRVSGTFGYATTPVRIQLLATKIVAKRVIDATIAAQAQEEGGSVTVGNISIDDPTVISVSSSKKMSQEIDDLFKDLVGDGRRAYRPSRRYELRR